MRLIEGYNFKINVPGTWAELNADQFATILEVLQCRKADKYTVAVSVLALLFGPKNYKFLRKMDDVDLHSLMPLTNFVFEEEVPLKNFFEVLVVGKEKLHAPAVDLGNISFGEWCFAYQMWEFYMRTKDVVFLDKLIAIVYRPASMVKDAVLLTGDVREVFNENGIDARAKAVALLDDKVKLAILAWFNVAIGRQMALRENVFPKNESESEEDVLEEVPGHTFLTIFRELLGAKWGTTEVLKNTNAMFVLDGLEEMRIQYKKGKA